MPRVSRQSTSPSLEIGPPALLNHESDGSVHELRHLPLPAGNLFGKAETDPAPSFTTGDPGPNQFQDEEFHQDELHFGGSGGDLLDRFNETPRFNDGGDE